jgi:hypothetical protein
MKRETLFSALKIVSFNAYAQSPDYIESVVSDDLRMQLSAHIGKMKVLKTENKHHVEFRIELIVATADEFFAEVKKYAESEMRRSPMFLDSSGIKENQQ